MVVVRAFALDGEGEEGGREKKEARYQRSTMYISSEGTRWRRRSSDMPEQTSKEDSLFHPVNG